MTSLEERSGLRAARVRRADTIERWRNSGSPARHVDDTLRDQQRGVEGLRGR